MIPGSLSRRGVARAVFVSDPGYMLRRRNVVDRFTILATRPGPQIAAFGPILEFAIDSAQHDLFSAERSGPRMIELCGRIEF
jgi:hypothetical protein